MPGPRVNQVGTSAGGAGDRLVCLRPVIEAGILGPALNAKSQRWALVEKDDCHRIVPTYTARLSFTVSTCEQAAQKKISRSGKFPRCVIVRTCRRTAPHCGEVRLVGARFSMLDATKAQRRRKLREST
jgi:hypothetical protein